MVSTIRFRSFKTLDSKARRPYTVLIFVAAGIVAIATHPQWTLVAIAYSYLASGVHRHGDHALQASRRGAGRRVASTHRRDSAAADDQPRQRGCVKPHSSGLPKAELVKQPFRRR